MSEYMPLIMSAVFLTVLSIAIKLLTGKSVHKKEVKQKAFDFPSSQSDAEPQPPMVAGARGR